ncbi:MAG: hypothetical protein HYR88_12195 [Verrucomicrobia bacterium]|nr:hypothetical protein [Verrucomicrobiota bacterium]MBI3866896.1 hypothetical protein [Verrucomicrobiota bacterium]
MNLVLQVKPSHRGVAAVDAWFLPGSDPACWLEELSRAGLANDSARVGIVGRNGPANPPAGALVMRSDRGPLAATLAGIPCSFIGRRLCVPSDAALTPPLSPDEADKLCAEGLVFLHPTLGVFSFGESDLCPLHDLLSTPPPRDDAWNRARFSDRLLQDRCEIEFVRPDPEGEASWETLFGEEANQIGASPPSDLAREKKKSGDKSGSVGPQVLDGVAQGLVHLTRLVSGASPGTGASWMERLREWALDRLGRDGVPHPREDELRLLRERELELLTRQLEENPEVGLQHAIPLTPQPHRGISEPGAKLPARSVDYASGHDGSRAADVWTLGESTHSKLRKIYFDLANREVVLGRFRRAAYIYAHLLGDFSSAANALMQGRFFREAAELYETRLGNPLQAARCLVEGGLLREAMERFERLGHVFEVAMLHEKLGEPEAAALLWRRLVAEALRTGDRLHAAQLLESRLRVPGEAAAVLREGWPGSVQAVRCLEAESDLLERTGSTPGLMDLVAKARDGAWRDDQVVSVLRVMNGIARNSRDAKAGARAEDASRVLASRRLASPELSMNEAVLITEGLALPWTRDPLLSRDLARYLQRRNTAQIAAARAASGLSTRADAADAGAARRVARRTLDFTLPSTFEWTHAQQEDSWFFAVGFNSARAIAVRGTWAGDVQTLSLGWDASQRSHDLLVQPTHQQGARLSIVDPRHGAIPPRKFASQDLFFPLECRVETPSWLPAPDCALAFEPGGAWTLHRADGRSILTSFSHEGRLRRTVDLSDALPVEMWDLWGGRPSLCATEDGVAAALGRTVVFVHPEGEITLVRLESDFVRYARSLPGKRKRLGVCLREGLDLFCPLRRTSLSLTDLKSPHAAWLSESSLMVVEGDRARQFQLVEDTSDPLREVMSFSAPAGDVLAALPTPQGHLAIFSKSGRVAIWTPVKG